MLNVKTSSRFLFLVSVLFFCGCKEPSKELSICFTGDLLLDRGVRQQIEHHGVPSLFKDVKSLFEKSDFVVANLECPVTKEVHPVYKRYIFRAEPEWLSDVKKSGITHLVMANNHTYDQGRNGLQETAKNIFLNNLISVGYGLTQEKACEPILFTKENIKVALFASVLLPLENWSYLPASPGICQATVEELKERIEAFKILNKKTQVVIILHWGAEFQESPSVEQRQQAMELIDAGADAIIGHHPHVIQKKFIYKNKPVFFSLGNFIFDQTYKAATKGLIAKLIFTDESIDYKEIPITIKNCRPQPD